MKVIQRELASTKSVCLKKLSEPNHLQVISLLRKYCLNDNEVFLEFISDPTINFCQSHFDRVNYEVNLFDSIRDEFLKVQEFRVLIFQDENLNIGLPIFTIHGNHDDMTGKVSFVFVSCNISF